MQATYHYPEDERTAASLEVEEQRPSADRLPEPAAVAHACEIVGDSWSLPIAAALLAGPLRYGELQELLPGLAPNILSARLRTLEQRGLISAQRYLERPPRFEYRLTAEGRSLQAAAQALATWASELGIGEASDTASQPPPDELESAQQDDELILV